MDLVYVLNAKNHMMVVVMVGDIIISTAIVVFVTNVVKMSL